MSSVSDFDAAWQQVAEVFEEIHGKAYVYRKLNGETFDITASVVSHQQTAKTDKDLILTTWHGHVFTMLRQTLVDNDVEYPHNGEEICEQQADDLWLIYRVSPPPKGKTYESVDTEDFQIEVYAVEVASRSHA
jgi:hypothetical protein